MASMACFGVLAYQYRFVGYIIFTFGGKKISGVFFCITDIVKDVHDTPWGKLNSLVHFTKVTRVILLSIYCVVCFLWLLGLKFAVNSAMEIGHLPVPMFLSP